MTDAIRHNMLQHIAEQLKLQEKGGKTNQTTYIPEEGRNLGIKTLRNEKKKFIPSFSYAGSPRTEHITSGEVSREWNREKSPLSTCLLHFFSCRPGDG